MDKDWNITEHFIPACIATCTFLTPYAVQEYWTLIFAHGFIWYFPFWRLYLGYDEGGAFAFVKPLGTGIFALIDLEILISLMSLVTGMLLASVMRKVGDDVNEYPMGVLSVIAALVIEISMPGLATLTMETRLPPSMITGLTPIPVPAIVAIVGLVYIRGVRFHFNSS